MVDTPELAAAQPPRGLAARVLGVFVSPGETYAEVARHPRVLGAMLLTIAVSCVAVGAFLSTEVGQAATLDQQLTVMDSFGFQMTEEQYAAFEQQARNAPYFAVAGQIVTLPLLMLIQAGILIGVFNVLLGGEASFKQVLAVVAHASLIVALQTAFVMPLNYARESLSSPTTLAVFFPMLDSEGFAAALLGAIDLFRIWWVVSLAIGLGVLYRQRTGPIAAGLFAVYGVIALVIAGVTVAFSRS